MSLDQRPRRNATRSWHKLPWLVLPMSAWSVTFDGCWQRLPKGTPFVSGMALAAVICGENQHHATGG